MTYCRRLAVKAETGSWANTGRLTVAGTYTRPKWDPYYGA